MNQIAEIVVDESVWQILLMILFGIAVLVILYWFYIGITRRMARSAWMDTTFIICFASVDLDNLTTCRR